jgi:hypothetical protein
LAAFRIWSEIIGISFYSALEFYHNINQKNRLPVPRKDVPLLPTSSLQGRRIIESSARIFLYDLEALLKSNPQLTLLFFVDILPGSKAENSKAP